MGFVNKNYPLIAGRERLTEAKGGGEEDELSAFMFLQEVAAFAGRVYSEDKNHG
jgi:hypothetical protein